MSATILRRLSLLAPLLVCLAPLFDLPLLGEETKRQSISIVTGESATRVERRAAEELAGLLAKMYTANDFVITNAASPGSETILLGVADSPAVKKFIGDSELAKPGSFVVKNVNDNGRRVGVIAGITPRALLDGVYSLLEKLGCGFYLSYNHVPAFAGRTMDFSKWEITDAPVISERIIFEWHNFLSSCSTWDLTEWEAWIRQVSRMRYSAIMVHAYGNNPMVCFTHNGETKPVGFLSTTYSGRDWGTEHVNDIRRLNGGNVFEGPVFGSSTAMVPDEGRVASAKELMSRVFDCAKSYGLDVIFAMDVDTEPANPQKIISTLPESAQIRSGASLLANPDQPEGYAYYRSQIVTLIADYPQITRLVVWFRSSGTLWRNLTMRELPVDWRDQFAHTVRKKPGMFVDHATVPSMFAISRLTAAYRKALDEIGQNNIKLGMGSWNFDFMAAADVFNSQEVAFFPLDYSIGFESPKITEQIKAVGLHRPVMPIVWAQHDDRTYLGRPYKPFGYFASQLVDSRSAGFGIIHWTTRPLDLYFKSLSDQTWNDSRDLSLKDTCLRMADRTFGSALREKMGEYLLQFVTQGPQFGRETTDRFIDQSLDVEKTVTLSRQRQALLAAVDVNLLDAAAREQFDYYRLLEKFFVEFFRNEGALQDSLKLMNEGQLDRARQVILSCKPESVIELYSESAVKGGISKGEQAMIISLNLRWLPYFVTQRQLLGVEPVRVAFRPTQYDPLAQGAGTKSFFFDSEKKLWTVLGDRETKCNSYELSANVDIEKCKLSRDVYREICAGGIKCKGPYTFFSEILPAGKYSVSLLFSEPEVTKKKERIFSATVLAGATRSATKSIDIFRETGNNFRGMEEVFKIELKNPEIVRVIIHPNRREAIISGIVIEPEKP